MQQFCNTSVVEFNLNLKMEQKTIRRFRDILRHFERELNLTNDSNCSPGVSLAQCHTLLELDSHDHITVNELSDRLDLDKSTVSRTIEGLVRIGLVHRDIPEENRRKVRISLSKNGKGVCRQVNRENDAYFEDVLGSIPEQDLPVFLKSFDIMIHKMIQLNKADGED